MTPTKVGWSGPGNQAPVDQYQFDLGQKQLIPPGVKAPRSGTQASFPTGWRPPQQGLGFGVLHTLAGVPAPRDAQNFTPKSGEVHDIGMSAPLGLENLTIVPHRAMSGKKVGMGQSERVGYGQSTDTPTDSGSGDLLDPNAILSDTPPSDPGSAATTLPATGSTAPSDSTPVQATPTDIAKGWPAGTFFVKNTVQGHIVYEEVDENGTPTGRFKQVDATSYAPDDQSQSEAQQVANAKTTTPKTAASQAKSDLVSKSLKNGWTTYTDPSTGAVSYSEGPDGETVQGPPPGVSGQGGGSAGGSQADLQRYGDAVTKITGNQDAGAFAMAQAVKEGTANGAWPMGADGPNSASYNYAAWGGVGDSSRGHPSYDSPEAAAKGYTDWLKNNSFYKDAWTEMTSGGTVDNIAGTFANGPAGNWAGGNGPNPQYAQGILDAYNQMQAGEDPQAQLPGGNGGGGGDPSHTLPNGASITPTYDGTGSYIITKADGSQQFVKGNALHYGTSTTGDYSYDPLTGKTTTIPGTAPAPTYQTLSGSNGGGSLFRVDSTGKATPVATTGWNLTGSPQQKSLEAVGAGDQALIASDKPQIAALQQGLAAGNAAWKPPTGNFGVGQSEQTGQSNGQAPTTAGIMSQLQSLLDPYLAPRSYGPSDPEYWTMRGLPVKPPVPPRGGGGDGPVTPNSVYQDPGSQVVPGPGETVSGPQATEQTGQPTSTDSQGMAIQGTPSNPQSSGQPFALGAWPTDTNTNVDTNLIPQSNYGTSLETALMPGMNAPSDIGMNPGGWPQGQIGTGSDIGTGPLGGDYPPTPQGGPIGGGTQSPDAGGWGMPSMGYGLGGGVMELPIGSGGFNGGGFGNFGGGGGDGQQPPSSFGDQSAGPLSDAGYGGPISIGSPDWAGQTISTTPDYASFTDPTNIDMSNISSYIANPAVDFPIPSADNINFGPGPVNFPIPTADQVNFGSPADNSVVGMPQGDGSSYDTSSSSMDAGSSGMDASGSDGTFNLDDYMNFGIGQSEDDGMAPPVPPQDAQGIGSKFGQTSPIDNQPHLGTDVQATKGTPVLNRSEGKVLTVEHRPMLGLTVIVRDKSGVDHTYGHLNASAVKPGDYVGKGQPIGQVGESGTGATGPNLHYAMSKGGKPLNPEPTMGPMGKMPMSPNTVGMGQSAPPPMAGAGGPPGGGFGAGPKPPMPPPPPAPMTPPSPPVAEHMPDSRQMAQEHLQVMLKILDVNPSSIQPATQPPPGGPPKPPGFGQGEAVGFGQSSATGGFPTISGITDPASTPTTTYMDPGYLTYLTDQLQTQEADLYNQYQVALQNATTQQEAEQATQWYQQQQVQMQAQLQQANIAAQQAGITGSFNGAPTLANQQFQQGIYQQQMNSALNNPWLQSLTGMAPGMGMPGGPGGPPPNPTLSGTGTGTAPVTMPGPTTPTTITPQTPTTGTTTGTPNPTASANMTNWGPAMRQAMMQAGAPSVYATDGSGNLNPAFLSWAQQQGYYSPSSGWSTTPQATTPSAMAPQGFGAVPGAQSPGMAPASGAPAGLLAGGFGMGSAAAGGSTTNTATPPAPGAMGAPPKPATPATPATKTGFGQSAASTNPTGYQTTGMSTSPTGSTTKSSGGGGSTGASQGGGGSSLGYEGAMNQTGNPQWYPRTSSPGANEGSTVRPQAPTPMASPQANSWQGPGTSAQSFVNEDPFSLAAQLTSAMAPTASNIYGNSQAAVLADWRNKLMNQGIQGATPITQLTAAANPRQELATTDVGQIFGQSPQEYAQSQARQWSAGGGGGFGVGGGAGWA